MAVGTNRRTSSKSIWRHALAFVAAYLLVLQTAFAGGAMQRMQGADALAMAVLCVNGQSQAPAESGQKHVAFDCCGMGCLVGAHALEGPASPDRDLTYPVEQAYEAGSTHGGLRSSVSKAHGPGLRGPPSAA